MKTNILFLSLALVASNTLAFVASADESPAPVQTAVPANPATPEVKEKLKEGRMEIGKKTEEIQADKAKLREDRKQFGQGSEQVKADKQELKKDRLERKSLRQSQRANRKALRGANSSK